MGNLVVTGFGKDMSVKESEGNVFAKEEISDTNGSHTLCIHTREMSGFGYQNSSLRRKILQIMMMVMNVHFLCYFVMCCGLHSTLCVNTVLCVPLKCM